MNKYVVALYSGSVENIDRVIKTKEAEANKIMDVDYSDMIPSGDYKYCRFIMFEPEKKMVIDFGSWSQFILIKKMGSIVECE